MGIYIPARCPDDWKQLLADAEKHWKTGFSAKALAFCWQEASGFPTRVREVFNGSGIELFLNAEFLLGIPEHKVPLPGGNACSQNDIWVLARSGEELISITVEGKVGERFGSESLSEWLAGASPGKLARLDHLQKILGLTSPLPDGLRYQLLHRAASAVIEAKRFNATKSLMLIHSFSQVSAWFEDYEFFLSLFGQKAALDSIAGPVACSDIDLYFGWVKGEDGYLKV